MKRKTEKGEQVCRNSKAYGGYDILETMEAGLSLRGSEVKSLRAGKADLDGSYAAFHGGELFVHHMHIAEYAQARVFGHEPKRDRKLLLHRRELEKLSGRVTERGLTLVPLRCYFRGGRAKLEIALAKGRKSFDKRQELRKQEHEKEVAAAVQRARKGTA